MPTTGSALPWFTTSEARRAARANPGPIALCRKLAWTLSANLTRFRSRVNRDIHGPQIEGPPAGGKPGGQMTTDSAPRLGSDGRNLPSRPTARLQWEELP